MKIKRRLYNHETNYTEDVPVDHRYRDMERKARNQVGKSKKLAVYLIKKCCKKYSHRILESM